MTTTVDAWSVPARARERIESIARRPSFEANPCLYLYDLEAISASIAHTGVLPKPFVVYYAMKANPHPQILDLMATHPQIGGVDVSSVGELDLALRFFHPSRISFTGPAKTPAELQVAVDAGIGRVHLESRVEAQRLNKCATRPIGTLVRLNSAHHETSKGNGLQFGIHEGDFIDAALEISKLPNVSVEGVHSFPGSGLLDADDAAAFACRTLGVAEEMTRHGMLVRSVNVGGGFGVDYGAPDVRFDVGRYGAALRGQPLINDLGLDSLTIDLGRFLVAAAGYYVTEIIDIKHAGTSIHLITTGGINHQRRPYAHDCNMPISILPRNHTPSQAVVYETEVTVNGPTLASYDVLGRNVWVDQADVGDLLVLGLAGAYGLNLAPVEFLLRPKAEEHVMNKVRGAA